MAYEYEEFIDAMRFGLTMSDRDSTDDIWKMVDEVVNKAKAFDEIVNLLKTDYMQYADDNLEDIEIIINEYMERADDEH